MNNTKKTFLLNLLLGSILLVTVCSCPDEPANDPPTSVEIASLIRTYGNLKSDIVILTPQGGPFMQLEDLIIKWVIEGTQASNVLYVNVHQAQTKNPNQFADKEITFDQAKQFDKQSVEYLKKVVDYFKTLHNKKVYILGMSFGAFLTQELIAEYGADVADKYLIIASRLDIEKAAWEAYSEGKNVAYEYDEMTGKFTIRVSETGMPDEMPNEGTIIGRNVKRLVAGLVFNRYTSKLANTTDLSKITYVSSRSDEVFGPLSPDEISFLENKGAQVLLTPRGVDQSGAIDFGVSQVKRIFDIK